MGKLKQDFTGQTIHNWKVLRRDLNPKSKSHETFWICECQNCGQISSVRRTDLLRETKYCNYCKGIPLRKNDIQPGDKFGELTIIERIMPEHEEYRRDSRGKTYYKCKCSCGKEINVRREHLLGQGTHSKTISCGCSNKSSGELKIESLLNAASIKYQYQYVIEEFSKFAPFDFAIFDGEVMAGLIEYDGEQHFMPVEYFGGEEKYQQQIQTDARKNSYCAQHGIKLLRIPYTQIDFISIDAIISYFQIQKYSLEESYPGQSVL